MRKIGFKPLLLYFFSASIFAAEVDHFTRRDEYLPDSAIIINHITNQSIVESIRKLNRAKGGCDEAKLYKELRSHFGNHLNGDFTKNIIKNPAIVKRRIPIKDSVLKNFGYADGLITKIHFFKKKGLAISDLVRVGEIEIGTDKFEHMFGRGFQYFSNYYLRKKTFESTVTRGINEEKFIYGGLPLETGIFSYGDLGANFNGMRFWNHILQKQDDILGKNFNFGPYIICQDQSWIRGRELDFRNYIDASMDESINCSKMATENGTRKYQNAVADLGFTCPIDPMKNKALVQKYGSFAKWIINTAGNEQMNFFDELGSRK